jgi:hypothetical protein
VRLTKQLWGSDMKTMYLLSYWDDYFEQWCASRVTANKKVADKWKSEGPTEEDLDYPIDNERKISEIEVLV